MTLGLLISGKDNLSPTLNRVDTKLGKLDQTIGNNRGKNRFNRALGSMATRAKKTSKAVIGSLSKMSDISTSKIALLSASLGAVAIGMGAVNQKTAEMSNLAQTVGLSYNTVNGLGGAIKGIGLDYQNVIDIKEELDNKVGESKSIYDAYLKGDKSKPLKLVGGLEDAFKGLDFSLSDKNFKGLNTEKTFKKFMKLDGDNQFRLVMDTALKMKDTQKAQSMVDILMGAEANKILGYLRKQGMTYDELLAKREKMNFMTKESLESAKLYSRTMGENKAIIGSIINQFSAVGGAFMTPYIQRANDWLILNKELIQQNITGFFDGVGTAIGNVNTVLGKIHGYLEPLIGLFGDTSDVLEKTSSSGETAGATLVYLATGLIGLKVATKVGSLGLKVLSKSFGLFGRKSKITTSLIGNTIDAVGDLAKSTRKPLSLQMGMKMPVKKTILGRMGSLISSLSRFALANPVVLGVAVSGAAFYGAYALYKETLKKDVMGQSEKRLSIAKREEEANVPLAQRTVSPQQAKFEKEQIKQRRENLNRGKPTSLKESLSKQNNSLSMDDIEKQLGSKGSNSFLSSVAPIKKEITNNKEVQINAPINITVHAVEGKAPVAEIARAVQESLKQSVRSKNNNVSHLDEEI